LQTARRCGTDAGARSVEDDLARRLTAILLVSEMDIQLYLSLALPIWLGLSNHRIAFSTACNLHTWSADAVSSSRPAIDSARSSA
jgi:hypothetical protein